MNNEIKLGMIANCFKQLEKSLNMTGLTIVNYVSEDTMREGILHVYDGNDFIGVIDTNIFTEREAAL